MKRKEEEYKMSRGEECYVSLTIERKLKAYAECVNHTDRHEILWHEWNHNKRWLTQVQQLILPSFPSYSKHDISHSESVVHNIEMLLGEDNIENLSATDCFVLLHTVYIHDIGMCITHDERMEILHNESFHEYLCKTVESEYSDMSYYAKILLKECFKDDNSTRENEILQYILSKKLDVYYAIIYLTAEFRRKEHGEISKDRLENWINTPDKLGIGFSTIDIPERLFYTIAHCASTHTKWDFEEVLKLKQEDSGFALDYVHPRFIAILLQLGDALDMDNDRFHPLTKEYLGKIPTESAVHYGKHKAIRRLRITNQKISIYADCKTQEELRTIRAECDGIKEILKNATFYWSVIKPKDSSMCLPTLDKTELLLQGEEIPSDLVKARFEISQEKAFNLLKGNNIYTEENFVFLRELLQNAVDATKIQYFRDSKRRLQRISYNKSEKEQQEKDYFSNPITIGAVISPREYPIDIELCIKKCNQNIYEDITYEDIKENDIENPEKELKGYQCGVLVRVRDYGIGINAEDVTHIAQIGSSYATKKNEINKMPSWLQPTGTFGIGLQSVFLSGKILKAFTYSISGEPYEITFYPRQEDASGYINVMPRKVEKNEESFGSCFEVFVPYYKKKLHKDSPETWHGNDPFEENYDNNRQLRHAQELLKQMVLYLTDMVGEALFPINLIIRDSTSESFDKFYEELLLEKTSSINMSITVIPKKVENAKTIIANNVTWAYNLDSGESQYVHKELNGDIYYLDCKNARLYVWNQEYNAYACIGIRRIFTIRNNYHSQENDIKEEGVKIFYKGIHVTKTDFKEDANLIEYIDLKRTLETKYLKLNRKGFSQEGYEYLEKVYRNIIKTARNALQYFGQEKDSSGKNYPTQIYEAINALSPESESTKLQNLALSATALTYFVMVNKRKYNTDNELNAWNEMLENIINIMTKHKNYFKTSALHNITFMQENEKVIIEANEVISIYEIIYNKNKFAILSERRPKMGSHAWNLRLVKCNSFHQKIKDKISKLRQSIDLSEREYLIEEIDKEGKNFLRQITNEELTIPKVEFSGQQIILKWIISNIPTMAIFLYKEKEEIKRNDGMREKFSQKNDEKEVRLNLLDVDIFDSVYFDQGMKKLTIDRILEKKEKVRRFSVPVWSGYEHLGLTEMRKSILFIKRGKLPKISYKEMIFPLTGNEIEDFLNNMLKDELFNKKDRIKEVYKNIFTTSFDSLSEKHNPSLQRYLNIIKELYNERKEYINTLISTESFSEIEGNKLESQEYELIIKYVKTAKKAEKTTEETIDTKTTKESIVAKSEEKLEKGIAEITTKNDDEISKNLKDKLSILLACLLRYWKDYEKLHKTFNHTTDENAYNRYCKDKTSYKNLKKYILEFSHQNISEEQIDSFYYLYLCEIQNMLMRKKYQEFCLELREESNLESFQTFQDIYDKFSER